MRALAWTLSLTALAADAAGRQTDHGLTPSEVERALELSPLPPPPKDPTNAYEDDARAARLGQAIFFDPRFSGNGEVSCATCHEPERSWTDGKPVASAVGTLTRNAPSLWNVAYNRWFTWDGRKDSLWSQALGPLEDPREHAGSRLQYAHALIADPDYARAYTEVFGPLPDLSDRSIYPPEGRPIPGDPDHPHAVAWNAIPAAARAPVDRVFANMGKALAAFQRKLVSRRAPFDVFVEGLREGDPEKLAALSPSAARGLRLFLGRAGCHTCHAGPNFTDLEFHDTRLPLPEGESKEQGRYEGVGLVKEDPFNGLGLYSDQTTGAPRAKIAYLFRNVHNWGEFKTPTLRNVALSAPYMHAGQMESLEEVLRFYSTLDGAQPPHKGGNTLLRALHLTEGEASDLLAFLGSLTDAPLEPALSGPPRRPWITTEPLPSPSGSSSGSSGSGSRTGSGR